MWGILIKIISVSAFTFLAFVKGIFSASAFLSPFVESESSSFFDFLLTCSVSRRYGCRYFIPKNHGGRSDETAKLTE